MGRECRSSASRVPLSSNATTTSHGLYKLENVVIVDLRMLAMYFYFLINHIELSFVGSSPTVGVLYLP